MHEYRRDPQRRLTRADAALAAGTASGAVQAAPRVWAFLDSWGLINHLAPSHPSDVAASSHAGDIMTVSPFMRCCCCCYCRCC